MALTRARLAQVNTTVASLQDPITLINRGADTANVDVGFVFNRDAGVSPNVAVVWNEGGNTFAIGYTTSTGANNSNVNITSYANLTVGNIFANIGGGTDTANVYITGTLLPTSNVTYDLGSNTNRFKTLWLANNTLDLGGETISVDANGTWVFSSNGSTVKLGTTENFNPPSISSTSGTFTTFTTTGLTVLANTSGNVVVASTTESSSTLTGALVIKGGAGVEGNVNANNVNTTTVDATTGSFTNLSGTLYTPVQPNITTASGLTSFGTEGVTTLAQGNLTIVGNLIVQGTTATISSEDLVVIDSIINLHTFSNLAPLSFNDGKDIGIRFHYYVTEDEHAFLGWANDTGYLEWYAAGNEGPGNTFIGTAYGTIKSGELLLANNTPSTSTSSGALRVTGGVGIAGELYIKNTNDVSANIGTLVDGNLSTNANLGSYQLYANANIGTISTNLTTLDANVGAFESYANTKIGTNTNGNLVIVAITESTTTTTGALVVSGGAGIAGNVTASKIYTSSGLFWSANGVSALATGGTTAGPTPPEIKKYGDLWYNTTNDVVYEYLSDGTSDYWIDISSQTIAANTSNTLSGNLTVNGNITAVGNSFLQLPTFTTTALKTFTGQAGWVAAISTTGELAYWDVANTRWSYVNGGGAV